MPLDEYRKLRNFGTTPEPAGAAKTGQGHPVFVIQEHQSSHHHFDLRLEHDGVLKSWAVPKGVPETPGEKRIAVETEDHPLEYGSFEGTIPKGQYGAGEVKIWDRGIFSPMVWETDKIEVILKGDRIEGRYVLIRFRRAGDMEWLIFKAKD